MNHAEIRALVVELRARRPRLAGLELVAALELRVRGNAGGPESTAVLAECLGMTVAQMEPICRWAESLLVASRTGAEFASCNGTSCTLRGAEVLARTVHEQLLRIEGATPGSRVLCFGQCDHGPTWRCGTELFLAGERRVQPDPRPWRRSGEERPSGES